MTPTTRADVDTALSKPTEAVKPITSFNELDIARALKLRFPGREIDTTEPIQVATEQIEEAEVTPETDKRDTPPDEVEEVLSDSEESQTVEASEDAETPEETKQTEESEEDADAKRYSERTKARIEKLAREKAEAKRMADEAAAKVAALESKLVELQSAQQIEAPKGHGPFSDIWDIAKLNDEMQKARQLKRWCEKNQHGAIIGDQELTEDQILSIKHNVEDALNDIPMRIEYVQKFNALRPEIAKVYPWVKDKNSSEYAESLRLKAMLPQLTLLPEHEVLIGDFLVGRKMRLELQKRAAAPVKPAPKPAPKQPGLPKQSPARVDAKQADAEAAKQRFIKSQGEHDLAKLLKSRGFA